MAVKPQKHRIALVFNTLYYPFTYPEILESLARRGYQIKAATPQPMPSGARVYLSGYVAAKKGCQIELNEGKGIIACEGTSTSKIVAIIKEIIDLSEKDFQIDISRDVDYCELISAIIVTNSGNPLDSIRKFYGNACQVFDDVLGVETAGYSVRIVPDNLKPTDKKWFDIAITPRFLTPDREYYVDIVFRDESNIDSVLGFAMQLNVKIEAMIDKIRGQ